MHNRYFIASIGAFVLSLTLAISPLTAMLSTANASNRSTLSIEVHEPLSPYSLPKVNVISSDTENGNLARSARSNLPIRYDLRDSNDITSVKDQNLFGSCWAFASIAAFESALIRQGQANASTLDLSEMQLAYFNNWTATESESKALGAQGQAGEGVSIKGNPLEAGGNALNAAYMIARGTGVTTEDIAPYANTSRLLTSEQVIDWDGIEQRSSEWDPNGNWSLDRSLATESVYQLHDMGFKNVSTKSLSDGTSEANSAYINTMKQDLMEHGALAISLCLNVTNRSGEMDEYTNTENGARFTNTKTPSNHMATVVGWDDAFSANNFNHKPSGDGAWIVKNSYGSMSSPEGNIYPWGIDNSGYFYVSYYDATIEDYSWFTPSEASQKSSITLQYDLLGYSNGSVVELKNANQTMQANIFTAPEDMVLKSVSATSPKNNATINTDIYLLDDSSTTPDSGKLAAEATTQLDGEFYTQIDLDTPVPLKKGQRLSVVQEIVAQGKSSKNWYVSVECGSSRDSFNYRGYKTKAISNPGESYVFQNGAWNEVSSSGIDEQLNDVGLKAGNVMIKAFGDPKKYVEEKSAVSEETEKPSKKPSTNIELNTTDKTSTNVNTNTSNNTNANDSTTHPLNTSSNTNLNTNSSDNTNSDNHPLSLNQTSNSANDQTDQSKAHQIDTNTNDTNTDQADIKADQTDIKTHQTDSKSLDSNGNNSSLASSSLTSDPYASDTQTSYTPESSTSDNRIANDAQRDTSNTRSDPSQTNSTLAQTGDDIQIVLLIFSFISALASVFFLAIGIKRSEF